MNEFTRFVFTFNSKKIIENKYFEIKFFIVIKYYNRQNYNFHLTSFLILNLLIYITYCVFQIHINYFSLNKI